MPNVTVLGVGSQTVTIPINSNTAATLAQSVLNAVSAAVFAGTTTPINFTGTTPTVTGSTELVFSGASAQSATVPAGSSFNALVSNSTALTTIVNNSTTAATVVSGSGGLAYSQTAVTVPGSVIVAGGGASNISLAAGANTVSVDVTPTGTNTVTGVSLGAATVNAVKGGSTIIINAATNNATTQDNALVLAGVGDVVSIAGSAAVGLADGTSTVTVLNGGAGFFAGASSSITAAAGDVTVGSIAATVSAAGQTQAFTTVETIIGALSTIAGATNTIFVAAVGTASGPATVSGIPGTLTTGPGNLFINPNVQNVTVFAGAGSTTLFGVGDGTAANSGRDVVVGGTGFFHAGSAGGSLLIGASSIAASAVTTLEGGGTGDALYAQSTNTSLLGSAGTALMVAGGITITGAASTSGATGVVSLGSGAFVTTISGGSAFSTSGAAGGVTINAGASSAVIFGSQAGSNTIISGSGSSTVFGHAGGSATPGNTYLDGKAGGSMTIEDFTGNDTFRLTGTQSVSGVAASGSASIVTLSDGTKITIANGLVTSTNATNFFHS